MSHVLIIGAAGQLGSALISAFPDQTITGADLDSADVVLDICDETAIRQCIQKLRPDHVITVAAVHEAALCEDQPELAWQVNAEASGTLARICHEFHARLIYVSTDYVFGASLPSPLRPYTETDPPAPVNVYGKSKAAGEALVRSLCPDSLIIRSASLYGLAPCRGKGGRNFVELMLAKAREGAPLRVVNDEITTPTNAHDLAEQISLLTLQGAPGIYHAVNKGFCSWYDFAQAIFEEFGMEADLQAVGREAFPETFPRPAYSLLDSSKLAASGLDRMPHWREGLKRYAAARSVES